MVSGRLSATCEINNHSSRPQPPCLAHPGKKETGRRERQPVHIARHDDVGHDWTVNEIESIYTAALPDLVAGMLEANEAAEAIRSQKAKSNGG